LGAQSPSLRSSLTGVTIFGSTLPARARPSLRREWPGLAAFAMFSMILFPLLMGIAMQLAPASHGAVVRAALPLLTGIGGTLIAGERPSLGFWVYSRLATGGSGDLQWADAARRGRRVRCGGLRPRGEMTRHIGG
jgi:drug/metabolite transporter (DMT)-like permease